MPPAGLEPAALCLASSIRLSLTARQSMGLLAGLYLGRRSPDPYSLWGAHSPARGERFPADYPILTACYLDQRRSKYQRLSGRPRIQGRPLNGFQIAFPIKAPTRQMLYPLSYRGVFSTAWHV